MQIVLSPSKNLKTSYPETIEWNTFPSFLDESRRLINALKKQKTEALMKLMNISFKLADLNKQRYLNWIREHDKENSIPAVYMFDGEVYNGLKADTLNQSDMDYAQQHLNILSGLYGVLKPLDGVQPYRLEMGTKLKISKYDDLYAFWGNRLTRYMKNRFNETRDKVLVNLASNEYYHAIDAKKLNCRVITPVFKDFKNGEYKQLTFYFKKARGMMARYIIQHRIEDPEQIKAFDSEGYFYNDKLTQGDKWVFTRD